MYKALPNSHMLREISFKLPCSECQRLPADENAGDVDGLPFQGGAGSRLLPLQLLWLQWYPDPSVCVLFAYKPWFCCLRTFRLIYAGTAGVWRKQAIVEPGGWEDRTTAEDMDLALRAGLRGWEFLYTGDIKVLPYTNLILPSCYGNSWTDIVDINWSNNLLPYIFRLRANCRAL